MKTPRLREWREAMGQTQVNLSERSGIAEHTISRIEQGASLRPTTARKLADALGVQVMDLIESPPVAASKGEASTGAGPKTGLEQILEAHGAPTRYLADDTLSERLQDMDAGEALAVGRAAAKELELIVPALLRRYEAAPDGTADKATASSRLVEVKMRGMALRWALRARFNRDPSPLPPAAAAQLSEDVEEVERALALAG